jgi:hypothetical protein
VEIKTGASTTTASATVREPGSRRRGMRGDPTLTLLAGALGVMMVETPASPAASSFDLPGIATLSGALFLLIWGLIKGSSYGWGSGRTLMFLGAAVLLGLLFVVRESRAAQPLLPRGCSAPRRRQPGWRWSSC